MAKEFKYKGSKPSYYTSYEYNNMWLVSKTTSAEGYVQEFVYDNNGNQTHLKDYGKSKTTAAVTRIVYDLPGRKIKEISPKYYTPSLESGTDYDVNNTDGNYTKYTYYPSGLQKSVTDAIGNRTEYEYDAYGNVITQTNPDHTRNITVYDGLGRILKTYFEGGGRLILTENSYEFVDVAGARGLRTTETKYITQDKQVISEVVTDYSGRTITERINGKLKRTSEYYQNGQLKSQTDAIGSTTLYEYGFLNLLTKTSTPFNGSAYSTFENTYYKNGLLETAKTSTGKDDGTNPTYSKIEYSYNALGLLTEVKNDPNSYTQYLYDKDGIKISMRTGLRYRIDRPERLQNYEYLRCVKPYRKHEYRNRKFR